MFNFIFNLFSYFVSASCVLLPVSCVLRTTQGIPAQNLRRDRRCRPITRFLHTTQRNPAKNLRRDRRWRCEQRRQAARDQATRNNFHGAKVWGIFHADSHIFPDYSHIHPKRDAYQLIINKSLVFLQRQQTMYDRK